MLPNTPWPAGCSSGVGGFKVPTIECLLFTGYNCRKTNANAKQSTCAIFTLPCPTFTGRWCCPQLSSATSWKVFMNLDQYGHVSIFNIHHGWIGGFFGKQMETHFRPRFLAGQRLFPNPQPGGQWASRHGETKRLIRWRLSTWGCRNPAKWERRKVTRTWYFPKILRSSGFLGPKSGISSQLPHGGLVEKRPRLHNN